MKSEEILKYLEKTDNENTTIQNLLDTAKAVLRGMFIAIQSSLKKKKKSKYQIKNLTYHLKELEKEQTKPKLNRRKKITKIKEEINKAESKQNNRKNSQELGCGFFFFFFWKDKQN